MQITICDICGEKIGKVNGKNDRYTFCVSHEPDSDRISPLANVLTHGEACGECARKIRDYIDNRCRDLTQAQELEDREDYLRGELEKTLARLDYYKARLAGRVFPLRNPKEQEEY